MSEAAKNLYLKKGATDVWHTPLEVTQALGKFDLDPCAGDPRPWSHARRNFTKADDGLTQPWVGRVWMNPPYSSGLIGPFVDKFVEHDDGVALVFPRIETRWFQHLATGASLVFLRAGRIAFCRPDGTPGGQFLGSVFVARGARNREALLSTSWSGLYLAHYPK